MNGLRKVVMLVAGLLLAAGILSGNGLSASPATSEAAALPAADWWLVVHDQCDDTLHWISPSGEFASIARPQLPGESFGIACSYRAMHISQNGRYLVQAAALSSGRVGIGFYDLQMGSWIQVHEAQPAELVYLGDRYSSDASNRIAVGFANDVSATRAWRVIIFDMATGSALESLESGGSEIASFVGGEFLATAAVMPHVTLLGTDTTTGGLFAQIRFDSLTAGAAPLGAVAWYPAGAPGVVQELISSPYTSPDMDLLPTRDAIFAYSDPAYPAGPPVGVAPYTITSNAIGMLRPTGPSDITPTPQIYFANGTSTVFRPQWAADGTVALFRLSDGVTERVHWVRLGTAVLMPMSQEIAQVLGVPTGFVYSTADGIYFMESTASLPSGPVFSDPMLSGSAAFVWATAFGNPALALDMPASPGSGGLPPTEPPPPTGEGPDLFVSEFSLNPPTPVQGQPVEVRVGVYNGGTTAAVGSFHIEWYAGENYTSPACSWDLDGMVARGGRILTCTYPGYPSWYTSINTRVLVDTANVIVEGNEANNGYTLPISVTAVSGPTPVPTTAGQADLYVSEFSLNPSTPVQGQPVQVRVGVYNGGTTAAVGSFHIEWYAGENYGSPACTWDLDGMVARGGRILTCNYAGYPSWYTSINTKVLVDTAGSIPESNEGNNGYTLAISVLAPAAPTPVPTPVPPPTAVGQPDLYVSEFTLNPATPVQGQPVQVRIGVYNGGTAAAVGSFHIEWYAGENYGSPACSWDLDGMVARGGRILTCNYAGYPSWYTSINTKAVVDTANTIAESNEGNNVRLENIRVTQP